MREDWKSWGVLGVGFIGIVGFVLGRVTARTEPPAPIHVEAAVAASKWEDERYKRLEHQVERQEDRLNRQSELIGNLNEKLSLHRHHPNGDAYTLQDDGGIPPHPHTP
jgi:F420-0:gamma-glutamyl ligase-like protein